MLFVHGHCRAIIQRQAYGRNSSRDAARWRQFHLRRYRERSILSHTTEPPWHFSQHGGHFQIADVVRAIDIDRAGELLAFATFGEIRLLRSSELWGGPEASDALACLDYKEGALVQGLSGHHWKVLQWDPLQSGCLAYMDSSAIYFVDAVSTTVRPPQWAAWACVHAP
jgi:hypothetical protein